MRLNYLNLLEWLLLPVGSYRPCMFVQLLYYRYVLDSRSSYIAPHSQPTDTASQQVGPGRLRSQAQGQHKCSRSRKVPPFAKQPP